MAHHPHTDQERIALMEMLDRILNKGAVIMGEATISVADVDLIYHGPGTNRPDGDA